MTCHSLDLVDLRFALVVAASALTVACAPPLEEETAVVADLLVTNAPDPDFTATTPYLGASGERFMPDAAFLNQYEDVTAHQDYDLIWRLRMRGFAGSGTRPEIDAQGRLHLLKFGTYQSAAHTYIRYNASGDFEREVEYAQGGQAERAVDYGVAADGTVAVLTDGAAGPRVQVFSEYGDLQSSWAAPDGHTGHIAVSSNVVAIPVRGAQTSRVPLSVYLYSLSGVAGRAAGLSAARACAAADVVRDVTFDYNGDLYALVTSRATVSAGNEGCDAVVVIDTATRRRKSAFGNARTACGSADALCVPRNIAVDRYGHVYVDRAESGQPGATVHAIQKLTTSGETLAVWDRQGCGLGGFSGNVNGGGILLAVDRARNEVLAQDGLLFNPGVQCGVLQRLSSTGQTLATYRTRAFADWFDATSGAIIGSDAVILARGDFSSQSTAEPWRLLRIDAAGRIVKDLVGFTAAQVSGVKIAADSAGRVYIPLKDTCRILRYDAATGEQTEFGNGCGTGAGRLTAGAPASIDFAADGRMFVLDRGCNQAAPCYGKGRVHIFNTAGQVIASWATSPHDAPRDLVVEDDGTVLTFGFSQSPSPRALRAYSQTGAAGDVWHTTQLGLTPLMDVVAIDADSSGALYLKGRNVRRAYRTEAGVLAIGAVLYQDPKTSPTGNGVGDVVIHRDAILVPDKNSTYRLRRVGDPVYPASTNLLFTKVGLFQLHSDVATWSFVVGNLSDHATYGEPFVVEWLQQGQQFLGAEPAAECRPHPTDLRVDAIACGATARTLTWRLPVLQPGEIITITYKTRLVGPFTTDVEGPGTAYYYDLPPAGVSVPTSPWDIAVNVIATGDPVPSGLPGVVVPGGPGGNAGTLAPGSNGCLGIICAKSTKAAGEAVDPNEKRGTPGPYVRAGAPISYTIDFENIGFGVAKDVLIEDPLSELLDLSSVRFVGSPAVVDIENHALRFELDGLGLPPLASDHVHFLVFTDESAQTGDLIANTATVKFDGAPLATNETRHYIDNQRPTSRLASLPRRVTGDFDVCWDAHDFKLAGVERVVVYAAQTGAEPRRVGAGDEPRGCLRLRPTARQRLCFYSTAVDRAGNVELINPHPDTCTTTYPAAPSVAPRRSR